jgi:radical SAM-linked protein
MTDKILSAVLPYVAKPGRYVGNEVNLKLPSANDRFRGVLMFAGSYELGMSNKRFLTLLHLLNKSSSQFWQRSFLPDMDACERMQQENIGLFTLEHHQPVAAADAVIIVMDHPMQMLNLGRLLGRMGISTEAAQRNAGPALFLAVTKAISFAPVRRLFDAVLLGETEAYITDIHNGFKPGQTRSEILATLAHKQGVVHSDTSLNSADSMLKRFLPKLSSRFFPHGLLFSHIDTGEKSYPVEIARGSVEGYRFWAGHFGERPYRFRKAEDIVSHIKNLNRYDGYQVFQLQAIQLNEYPQLPVLLKRLKALSSELGVTILVPGFTFNAESPLEEILPGLVKNRFEMQIVTVSETLRRQYNIAFPVSRFEYMMGKLSDLGWEHFQVSFMVGLPGQDEAEYEKISSFINGLERFKKEKGQFTIIVEVIPFLPEPFSPLQWEKGITAGEYEKILLGFEQRNTLGSALWKGVDKAQVQLMTVLNRSGEHLADFFLGTHQQPEEWIDAYRALDEVKSFSQLSQALSLYDELPWKKYDFGVSWQFLTDEKEQYRNKKITYSCRHFRCYKCGLQRSRYAEQTDCHAVAATHPEKGKYDYIFTDKNESDRGQLTYGRGSKKRETGQQQIVKKLRIVYRKEGTARFISHQEVGRIFDRAARLSGFPLAYTQGKIPKPKMSFGVPLQLGIPSTAEYFDAEILVTREVEMLEKLNRHMLNGVVISGARAIFKKIDSLVQSTNVLEYRIQTDSPTSWSENINARLALPELLLEQPVADGVFQTTDIKPYFNKVYAEDNAVVLHLNADNAKTVRIFDFLKAIEFAPWPVDLRQITRTGQFHQDDTGRLHSLLDVVDDNQE